MDLCNTLLILTLGVPILAILAAYMMAPTFPETANNRGLKTAVGMGFRFIERVGDIGEALGFSKVKVMRSMFETILLPKLKSTDIEEYTTTIEGVEVWIVRAAGTNNGQLKPGIVHYHGGGWILRSPAEYSPVIFELARQTRAVIISVHYRRAPEHVFPAAIDDCIKVTKYFLKHAERYGVDKNRVGLKGDSAGGNLVMAAALALTKDEDSSLPTLKFISLDYPALQAVDFTLPCYIQYEHGPSFLNKKVMIDFWLRYAFGNMEYYDLFSKNSHISKNTRESKQLERVSAKLLPERYERYQNVLKRKQLVPRKESPAKLTDTIENVVLNPLFSPLLATDEELSKLPAVYVMNAEFDVLRDDGFILVERLRSLGAEVEHSYLPGEEHACLNTVEVDRNILKEYENFAKFFNKTVGN